MILERDLKLAGQSGRKKIIQSGPRVNKSDISRDRWVRDNNLAGAGLKKQSRADLIFLIVCQYIS